MKLNGKAVAIREVQEVRLERSNSEQTIVLKVSGYPIGIRRAYETVYPKPQAPIVESKIVRVGKEPEKSVNYDDPEYIKKISDWIYFEKFFIIHKCLSVDTNLEMEQSCKTIESIKLFEVELYNAGFSEGDIGRIFDAIQSATNIQPKAIEEAKENFTASLT
jgi:hypothetical protein